MGFFKEFFNDIKDAGLLFTNEEHGNNLGVKFMMNREIDKTIHKPCKKILMDTHWHIRHIDASSDFTNRGLEDLLANKILQLKSLELESKKLEWSKTSEVNQVVKNINDQYLKLNLKIVEFSIIHFQGIQEFLKDYPNSTYNNPLYIQNHYLKEETKLNQDIKEIEHYMYGEFESEAREALFRAANASSSI